MKTFKKISILKSQIHDILREIVEANSKRHSQNKSVSAGLFAFNFEKQVEIGTFGDFKELREAFVLKSRQNEEFKEFLKTVLKQTEVEEMEEKCLKVFNDKPEKVQTRDGREFELPKMTREQAREYLQKTANFYKKRPREHSISFEVQVEKGSDLDQLINGKKEEPKDQPEDVHGMFGVIDLNEIFKFKK